MFNKYHYLDHKHNNAANVYVCYINDCIAGFISVITQPGSVKNLYRVHRMVVLPDYQGIGIGIRMLNEIAEIYFKYGKKFSITSSAPSLLKALSNSNLWVCGKFGRNSVNKYNDKSYTYSTTRRISASFQYKKNFK